MTVSLAQSRSDLHSDEAGTRENSPDSRGRPLRAKSTRIRHSMSKESLNEVEEMYGRFHDDIRKVPEDMDCDIQTKLMAVWDTLSLSTQARLDFMAKYSSSVVAAEMGTAIDYYGEVAVLFALLLEAQSFKQKVTDGVVILPIEMTEILCALVRKIHPLLASTSSTLVPLQFSAKEQMRVKRYPLSALALARVRNLIIDEFDHRDQPSLSEVGELKDLLENVIFQTVSFLVEKTRKVQMELEDIVLYKDKSMREWLVTNGFYSTK